MDYIQPNREAPRAVVISDPRPVDSVGGVWTSLSRAANIGIFLLLFGAVLYFGRAILLPIVAAAVVALTLAPLVKAGKRRGISPWITALLIVACGVGAVSLAATALAGPVSEWIGRAPDIWASVKERMARPVRKWFRHDNLTSLHQRIRSRGASPAKMEIRASRSS